MTLLNHLIKILTFLLSFCCAAQETKKLEIFYKEKELSPELSDFVLNIDEIKVDTLYNEINDVKYLRGVFLRSVFYFNYETGLLEEFSFVDTDLKLKHGNIQVGSDMKEVEKFYLITEKDGTRYFSKTEYDAYFSFYIENGKVVKIELLNS